jgi:hypothetical protein
LLKGIDVEQERMLEVEVSLPTYGSSEGFEVGATLRSRPAQGQPARTHYRCVVRLAQQYPEPFEIEHRLHAERQLTVAKAYDEWLFHGPRFQVIERFDGLSRTGAQAIARSSRPAEWLTRDPHGDRWLFDPALVDAGAQMALLWARSFRDETALPVRFGRVTRYGDELPARTRMVFECLPTAHAQQVRANVYFVDAEDRVVLFVEGLESIASSALNRIARGASAPATALRLGTHQ